MSGNIDKNDESCKVKCQKQSKAYETKKQIVIRIKINIFYILKFILK